MKMLEVTKGNVPTKIPFADGTLWMGDHFGNRAKQRVKSTESKKFVDIMKKAKNSEFIKNEMKSLRPKESVVFYNSSYFGVAIIKNLEKDSTAYTLKTISQTLYPLEGQKLYMVDESKKDPESKDKTAVIHSDPRRFTRQDHNNMPWDMKRYKLETWNNPQLSADDIKQIDAGRNAADEKESEKEPEKSPDNEPSIP